MQLGDTFVDGDGIQWIVIGDDFTHLQYECARIPDGETDMSMGRTWSNNDQPKRLIPITRAEGVVQ